MRKLSLILLLALAVIIPAAAQKREKSKEEMRKELHEFKLKFIAQEIELKPDQQKPFFDLYEQRRAERRSIRTQKKQLERRLKHSKDATDEEYAAVTKGLQEVNEKIVAIDKKYDAQFAKFISQKQIFKMHEAEELFRAKMREMSARGKR